MKRSDCFRVPGGKATTAPPMPVSVAERRKVPQLRHRQLKLPGSKGSVSLTSPASGSSCLCISDPVWLVHGSGDFPGLRSLRV